METDSNSQGKNTKQTRSKSWLKDSQYTVHLKLPFPYFN